MPWSVSELQVRRTPGVILKDPTFVGVGLHGPLTGKRADLIIVDDPFDESEIRTEAQRKKVEDWIEKVLIPTLTPQGEIVWEYVSPFCWNRSTLLEEGMYRAYRYGYDRVPQAIPRFMETDGHLGVTTAEATLPARMGMPATDLA